MGRIPPRPPTAEEIKRKQAAYHKAAQNYNGGFIDTSNLLDPLNPLSPFNPISPISIYDSTPDTSSSWGSDAGSTGSDVGSSSGSDF